MRILIGAGNYPKVSESYIEAEIQYLLRHGHEVAVYSPVAGSPEAPEIVTVFRRMEAALAKLKPQVFHAHYLTFDWNAIEAAGKAKVPVTIRGHSFDFDVNRAKTLAARSVIKKIWLFPHFAKLVGHGKVDPLPVAFDSSLYKPAPGKDRRSVYRTGAGKNGKGLKDVFEVAKLCPGFKFSLSANIVLGEGAYLGVLEEWAKGSSVELSKNISREEAVSRMNSAGIYLDTSDPHSHAFGMPISIAEAMATGCYVLARKNDVIGEYVGNAGALYGSVEEAAALIKETEGWNASRWSQVAAAAVERSRKFSDEEVLKSEVGFWESVVA